MSKGFAPPKQFRGSGDLRAELASNWRYLTTFLNNRMASKGDVDNLSNQVGELSNKLGDLGEFKIWTPVVSGLTFGAGGLVEHAVYSVVGDMCFFSFSFLMGSTGLSVGDVRFTWPPPTPHPLMSINNVGFGDVALVDSGSGVFPGNVRRQGAGTFQIICLDPSAGTRWSSLSPTRPFTWAAGDRMSGQGWYLIDPSWSG